MSNDSFARFLDQGKTVDGGVPQGVPLLRAYAEDAEPSKMAKTLLKKTLAEHDQTYHPDGFKEGDECNFRAALAAGDPVDLVELKSVDEPEEKVGLVKYIEKPDGEKEITGVQEVGAPAEAETEAKAEDEDGGVEEDASIAAIRKYLEGGKKGCDGDDEGDRS